MLRLIGVSGLVTRAVRVFVFFAGELGVSPISSSVSDRFRDFLGMEKVINSLSLSLLADTSTGADFFDLGGENTTSLFSSIGSSSNFFRAVFLVFFFSSLVDDDDVSESPPFDEPLLLRIRLERRTTDGGLLSVVVVFFVAFRALPRFGVSLVFLRDDVGLTGGIGS